MGKHNNKKQKQQQQNQHQQQTFSKDQEMIDQKQEHSSVQSKPNQLKSNQSDEIPAEVSF